MTCQYQNSSLALLILSIKVILDYSQRVLPAVVAGFDVKGGEIEDQHLANLCCDFLHLLEVVGILLWVVWRDNSIRSDC